MALVGLIFGGIAAVLNFLLGEPIALMLAIVAIMSFLQFKHYSQPYVVIEDRQIKIRFSWLKKGVINLEDIARIESKKRQLNLHLKDRSKKGIALFYMPVETQQQLSQDLSDLFAGEAMDLSAHLTA